MIDLKLGGIINGIFWMGLGFIIIMASILMEANLWFQSIFPIVIGFASLVSSIMNDEIPT